MPFHKENEMDHNKIMGVLAQIHNTLFDMRVSQEQTLIVSDCVRALREVLDEMNQSTQQEPDKE